MYESISKSKWPLSFLISFYRKCVFVQQRSIHQEQLYTVQYIVFSGINAPGAKFLEAIKNIPKPSKSHRFCTPPPPLKNHLPKTIGFMCSLQSHCFWWAYVGVGVYFGKYSIHDLIVLNFHQCLKLYTLGWWSNCNASQTVKVIMVNSALTKCRDAARRGWMPLAYGKENVFFHIFRC